MSFIRVFLIYSVILLFTVADKGAFGQVRTSIYQKQFNNYTTNNGLSQNTVRVTFQDSRGFIWLGTTYGLNRFDGNTFKTYTSNRFSSNGLSHHWVNAIVEQKDGSLWLGTNGGLNKLESDLETFSQITDSLKQFIQDNRIISLHFSNDSTLWLGTFKGFARYNVHSNSFIPTQIRLNAESIQKTLIHDFYTDELGFTWIATDEGLFRWNPNHEFIEKMPIFLKNQAGKEANLLIRTIIRDVNGTFWIGTRYNSVFQFNRNKDSEPVIVSPFKFNDKFLTSHITSIVSDEVRSIWIGTRNGLYAYDLKDDALVVYTDDKFSEYRFKDEMVMKLYVDSFKNLWVASQASGVYITALKNSSFQLLPIDAMNIDQGIHKEIWTVFGFKNQVYFSTVSHIFSFSPETNAYTTLFSETQKGDFDKNPAPVLSFVEDKDGFIMSSLPLGLIRYSEMTKKFTQLPEPKGSTSLKQRIFAMTYINSSELLLGAQSGLWVYNEKEQKMREIKLQNGESLKMVYVFQATDDDKVWVGTENGIFQYNSQTDELHELFPIISGQNNQVKHKVIALWFDDKTNTLWLGTTFGLLQFDVNTGNAIYYDTKDGLTSSMILALVYDRFTNRLWASTNRGLVYLEVPEKGKKAELKVINRVHQFVLNEYNAGAFYNDNRGNIYFGGVAGLTYFNSSEQAKVLQKKNNQIHIYKVEVQQDTTYHSYINEDLSSVVVPSETGTITIHFVYPDYSDMEGREFVYRIKETNSDWNSLGKSTKLILSNTNYGVFTVQLSEKQFIQPIVDSLKNAKNVQKWDNQVLAELKITQLPHFWQMWQFRLILILVLISLAYFYYLRRVNWLKKINLELEESVAVRTKELSESNEKLSRSEELFRTITEHAADLIIMSSFDGVITYCSPSVETILGYNSEAVQKSNVKDFVHPDDFDIIEQYTKKIFDEGKAVFKPYRIKDSEGNWRYFTTSGSGIPGKNGRTESIITVSHDVSKQYRLQELATKAKEAAENANKAKSNFLASISHELRTPLNAILGYSRILADDANLPEKQREFASVMYKSGDHLLSMINEILDLSKIEAGRMEIQPVGFSLFDLLNDLKSIFQLQIVSKRLELTLDYDKSIPNQIIGDSNKVRQIIMNALSNAIKFTEKGTITIVAKQLVSDETRSVVRIDVIDTGIGIPKDQIDQLFQPFKQVEGRFNKGTGLGLAISNKLAELLSGKVELKSKENEGSEFSVILPFLKPLNEFQSLNNELNATIVPIKSIDFPISFSGKEKVSVLIIDDIQTNLSLLGDTLEPIGFSCYLANDGLSGLKLMYEKEMDLVLMDLRMPGMSGEEVLREIKKESKFSEIPIIAVTASGFLDTRESTLALGFDACIFKPVDFSILFSELGRILSLQWIYPNQIKIENKSTQVLPIEKQEIGSVSEIANSIKKELSMQQLEKLKEMLEITDIDALRNWVNQENLSAILKNNLESFFDSNKLTLLISLAEELEN